jgi:hypothetical protein
VNRNGIRTKVAAPEPITVKAVTGVGIVTSTSLTRAPRKNNTIGTTKNAIAISTHTIKFVPSNRTTPMMDVLLTALEMEDVPPRQTAEASLTMRNEQNVIAVDVQAKPIQSNIEARSEFRQ